jgi:hypothetical protein
MGADTLDVSLNIAEEVSSRTALAPPSAALQFDLRNLLYKATLLW